MARTVRRFFQRETDMALNSANQYYPGLLGIPDELKRNVFKYITTNDFVHLSSTCRGLNSYKKDIAIWKYFLKKDYKMKSDDPYEFYVSKYCTNKDMAILAGFFPVMMH